ncbi:endonuclease/exonuclease/phosphatase family protein [Nonomuraea sp. NPDC050328]|uniref:endonuclease/exonuclease/phosphatase family protein n=1 Tax=Nonomuraea sp. NPDC050328 TaxID=3364361 RepID=UPI0037B7BC88
MLSVLTVNVGAASRDRAERILAWLATRPEHVILLTETSAGAGTAHLLDAFARAGWAVVNTPDVGDRGAALVSRIALADEQPSLSGITVAGRVATAWLDTQPQVLVASVYIPSRDRSQDKVDRKQQFTASLLRAVQELPERAREHLVLGGDYNSISRTHEPRHPGFLAFEYALLDALSDHGMVDAHDLLHPGAQPHSWIGRTGDGYRYDYLHVGSALRGTVTEAAYLHDTREQSLTDHAAVTMTLQIKAAELATRELGERDEIALF